MDVKEIVDANRANTPEPCIYCYHAETRDQPAEYCWNEAGEDSEYCPEHDPDNWQPDWDDRRKDMMYDCE